MTNEFIERVSDLNNITSTLTDLLQTYGYRNFTLGIFLIESEDWLDDFVARYHLTDKEILEVLDSTFDAYLKREIECLTTDLLYDTFARLAEEH